MGRVTTRRRVLRLSPAGEWVERPDSLAGEEPLELRVGGRALAVTMRTPGHDVDLALGFLVGEGVINAGPDVAAMRYCVDTRTAADTRSAADTRRAGSQTYNILDITLAAGVPPPDASVERAFYTSSSCGLCGKTSIDAVRMRGRYQVDDDPLLLDPEVILALPERLREAQRVFTATGGLHAAAIADAGGRLLVVREDVGRHNAVDKVVGWAAREGHLPLRERVLVVSGRASFELTQKALLAGIPALVAVSAPSSLAADLAEDAGMTLVGFVRGNSMNVYTGANRITGCEAVDAVGSAVRGESDAPDGHGRGGSR